MGDNQDPVRRPASPPRRQRACEPCTKAKARCNFQPNNVERHLCDRCQTMEIDCLARTSKSMRKPRQLKPLVSRVASLEQKLDNLASLLTAPQPSLLAPPSGPSMGLVMSQQLTIDTPESVESNPDPASALCDQSVRGFASSASHSSPASTVSSPPFGFTWQQATLILAEFQQKYTPNFPFVYVSQDVSAQNLYSEKPFLFMAIMLVAAPVSRSRIDGILREFLTYLGQHMLVEDERQLDLLQGLLVCLAWSGKTWHAHLDHRVTNLTFLAVGYAHNLGLTKIPPTLGWGPAFNAPEDIRIAKIRGCNNIHSLEEQRAYLGCFYLGVLNSVQFARRLPLKGSYVRVCCDAIAWSPSAPTDYILAKVTRLMGIVDKVADTFGIAYSRERSASFGALLEGKCRDIHLELSKLAEDVLPEHPDYMAFRLHYNYVLARLYEPAAFLTEPAQRVGSSIYHIQCLSQCLGAAKEFFDTVFSLLTPENYLYQSLVVLEQISFILVLSTRLLFLEVEGWDLNFARIQLDLPTILDNLEKQLSDIIDCQAEQHRRFARETGMAEDGQQEDPKENPFYAYMIKTRRLKLWYSERLHGVPSEVILAQMDQGGLLDPGQRGHFNLGGNLSWFSGLLRDSSWNFDNV